VKVKKKGTFLVLKGGAGKSSLMADYGEEKEAEQFKASTVSALIGKGFPPSWEGGRR